jgi:DNA-binding MarR family transcriptional regulator
MTRMLAVLEEGGYVERTSDPADRRASHLARHLTALTPDERRALADALPVLESLAATDTDAAPSPDISDLGERPAQSR